MGFFSDLVKGFEADVRKVLPTDGPHDTRELADLAKSAEGVADTLDPELEPLFATVGAAGDAVDVALHDLAEAVGTLHTGVAKKLAKVKAQTAAAVAAPVEPTEPVTSPAPDADPVYFTTNLAADALTGPWELTDLTTTTGVALYTWTGPNAPDPSPNWTQYDGAVVNPAAVPPNADALADSGLDVPPTEPPAAPSPGSATPGASTEPTPSSAPAPTSDDGGT